MNGEVGVIDFRRNVVSRCNGAWSQLKGVLFV